MIDHIQFLHALLFISVAYFSSVTCFLKLTYYVNTVCLLELMNRHDTVN